MIDPEIEHIASQLLIDGQKTIGNDLVFLPHFSKSFSSAFKRKVYTEEEVKYCESFDNTILRYASTFAAKEAIYKALKQLDDKIVIPWRKIEIKREKPAGKPVVKLNIPKDNWEISLSLTHDGDYAWAVALIMKVDLK